MQPIAGDVKELRAEPVKLACMKLLVAVPEHWAS